MKKRNRKFSFSIYSFLILIATICMAIGYAAVNSVSLDIDGEAGAIEQNNIFITDAQYVGNVDADLTASKVVTTYQTLFQSEVTLSPSNGNSSITYSITVYNSTNDEYFFKGTEYDEEFYSNQGITFDLSGMEVGTLLNGKEFLTFEITFHYVDNVVASSNFLSSYLNFEFVRNRFADIVLASNDLSDDCPNEVQSHLYLVDGVEKESRFCKAKDNFGDTYYFRGSSDNNYVSFAGSTWRIMRVNGTGSVRLLYEGDIGLVNMGSDAASDNADIGYIYGTSSQGSYDATHTNQTDSAMKKAIDTWYENNILGKYDEYVDAMYFYNDRSTTQTLSYYQDIVSLPVHYDADADWGVDTGLGFGQNNTYYGTWLRLVDNIENYYRKGVGNPYAYPTFYCASANDCYTSSSDLYGVNVLKYPVASITMDDAVFAGTGYKENNANDSSYIYYGGRFQLIAFPVFSTRVVPVCNMIGTHSLGNGWITCGSRGNFAVRPVINVKGDLIVTSGNGSKESPYVLGIKENTSEPEPDEPTTEIAIKVEEKLQSMSLKDKIGQMIIVSASGHGTTLSSSFTNIINTVHPGGVLIMSDNVGTKDNLSSLISGVNQLNSAYTDIPLIWGVDQEGGRVQRLSSAKVGATTIPQMYDLGMTGNPSLAYDVGVAVGEELRVFGFNMDFAPVADIWSNPNNTVIGKRSFGNDSALVSKMTLPFAEGLESTGVTAVFKHFPGHGDTLADSHVSLPLITKSKEELLASEIIPFQNAIANGAKVIMVGHLAVPALTGDNTTPTSLSKSTITDFLKGELGFDGIVVTDGLNMAALNAYSKKDLYTMALNAGVDLLLGPTDPVEAANIIYEGIQNGTISEDIINTSVRKILTLKYEMNETSYDDSYLGSTAHKDLMSQIPSSN